ncbi:hypothetical protein [Streptomyces griseorubiginosus]|uniref:hypothetical protein n=1 Tax=Streptomyces griseorubiginosus TaxID=67304 RepID=UPI0036E7183B
MFKTAVDARVQSVKSSVDQQVGELRSKVDALKADADALKAEADAVISRKMFPQVPISGFKEEIAGLNAAVNVAKAEFNVFDPIKIFRIQDKYDEWLLSRINLLKDKVPLLRKKKDTGDQKPEKPLTQEGITKDEIKRAKIRINLLEERLNKPPTISDMRRDISTNRKWAENKFRVLAGEKHGREAPPKGRKLDAIPNVRQLERQEQQLRNTIKQFVRVVKGAIPESAALAKEMARIEQQLK